VIGNRTAKQMLTAPFQRRHYTALFNMSRNYPRFSENLWRYLTGKGTYPYDVIVRTPVGPASIRLYSHHDLLTVNEIFCRQDYFATGSLRTVVDIGSNIGISALYFLTRNNESKCVLYEPDPKNVARLKQNLADHEDRYSLVEAAVSDASGQFEFGIEPTGRYGGIGIDTGQSITVPCLHINDVVRNAVGDAGHIDILKIDTEGVEIRTVNAIDPGLLLRISTIYLEARPAAELHPQLFANKQYGSVRQLTRLDTQVEST
jgi:FkbM family methyltransferase